MKYKDVKFQLTRLMRGVTAAVRSRTIFILTFQLTRLMRGVTVRCNHPCGNCAFQLTRLMRGVTATSFTLRVNRSISTHTPHARRDLFHVVKVQLLVISTHTPHARRDRSDFLGSISSYAFQLTRLMRGVTRIHKNGIT